MTGWVFQQFSVRVVNSPGEGQLNLWGVKPLMGPTFQIQGVFIGYGFFYFGEGGGGLFYAEKAKIILG